MSSVGVIALVMDGHFANWGTAEQVHQKHKAAHAKTDITSPPLALDNFLRCKKCGTPWPCDLVTAARRLPQGEVLTSMREMRATSWEASSQEQPSL